MKAGLLSPDYLEAVLDLVYGGNLKAAQDYALRPGPTMFRAAKTSSTT